MGVLSCQSAMAMEYRANFVIQVFGMVLNDALWSFLVVVFQQISTGGRLVLPGALLLYAVLTLGFGLGIGVHG